MSFLGIGDFVGKLAQGKFDFQALAQVAITAAMAYCTAGTSLSMTALTSQISSQLVAQGMSQALADQIATQLASTIMSEATQLVKDGVLRDNGNGSYTVMNDQLWNDRITAAVNNYTNTNTNNLH